jgi:hypothetical protein
MRVAGRALRVAGALLFLAADPLLELAQGQGTIAYFDPPDVLLLSSGVSRRAYELDFDQDGSAEFTLVAQAEFQVAGYGQSRFMAVPAPNDDLGSRVVPFTVWSGHWSNSGGSHRLARWRDLAEPPARSAAGDYWRCV